MHKCCGFETDYLIISFKQPHILSLISQFIYPTFFISFRFYCWTLTPHQLFSRALKQIVNQSTTTTLGCRKLKTNLGDKFWCKLTNNIWTRLFLCFRSFNDFVWNGVNIFFSCAAIMVIAAISQLFYCFTILRQDHQIPPLFLTELLSLNSLLLPVARWFPGPWRHRRPPGRPEGPRAGVLLRRASPSILTVGKIYRNRALNKLQKEERFYEIARKTFRTGFFLGLSQE